MKANELMQIFELGKTFAKVDKPRRRKKELNFDFNDIDMTLLLQKKLEEAATIKKFLEDHHKINKKEEKKEAWNIAHVALFLMLTFPITAPLYVAYLNKLLH